MSACDSCLAPGRCCTGLMLNSGTYPAAEHPLEALVQVAAYMTWDWKNGRLDTMPFMPFYRCDDGKWKMWCPNLTREGRCGDYENRPFACRHYEPGTDRLCVMHGFIAQPTYGKVDTSEKKETVPCPTT